MKFEHVVFEFHGGMHVAMANLRLTRLFVVHPGGQRFALADGMEAVPLGALLPD